MRNLGLLVAVLATPAVAAPQFSAEAFKAHVSFLADDLLAGRDTGSPGHEIASRYVVAQLSAAGVTPAGADGSWYQPVRLREATLVPGSAAFSIDANRAADDAVVVGANMLAENLSLSAPVVFAGHCLVEPSLKIDDFRGLDVKGKIVACLTGFPKGLPSETAAYLTDQRARFVAARGAIGMISLWGKADEARRPFASVIRDSSNPRMQRLNPDGSPFMFAPGLRGAAVLSTAVARQLFAGARRSFDAVDAEGQTRSVRGFALPSPVTITSQSRWRTITSHNVVGMVKGSDPALAEQIVVLGAHLDHIGTGTPINGDAINNGALDNAAGSATLIEVAKATAANPPKRSVLFVAATAEEKGLLGAEAFAANPTVDRSRIVSMIDLDMPILTYDFRDVTAYGADHSTIAADVAAAAGEMGVALAPDPLPEETIFVRSDHYAFVQRGIPAIMLSTGFGGDGKAAWMDFLANHYHQPSDDLKLPIRWQQGARFAELNWRIMDRLANAATPPRWYKGDFFGDRFAPTADKAPPPAR
ncbi:M28 family peptidase [Sandarakinorhabdus oryzae]|uniref:M28 family peptidase n=1 Tax=Sandarakinorhabdus oryzae TaxID=2675220 RepID=UPI001F48F655|nr:M28 family peptidase [Sandarakinorhabdus oryzae]